MAKIPSINAYALLFENLKQQGIFEGYRQGVKALGEPPQNISSATIDRAEEKVLKVTLASFAQKSPALLQMMCNAAFELLLKRLYRDVKNKVDHVTDSMTPNQLFNQLMDKDEK